MQVENHVAATLLAKRELKRRRRRRTGFIWEGKTISELAANEGRKGTEKQRESEGERERV